MYYNVRRIAPFINVFSNNISIYDSSIKGSNFCIYFNESTKKGLKLQYLFISRA